MFILFSLQDMKLLLTICLVTVLPGMALAQRANLTRQQIKEAERLLSAKGFWTGPIDGIFDAGTRSALIAFQKWHGSEVTGQLTPDELEAIRTSTSPRARELGYEHVEVDLDRQVLMMVGEDGGVKVLPVSTGSNKAFMDDGQESIAYTPRGRFLVYEKDVGWQSGPLGSTYYANFISGGVAIHGSRNVPNEPASHGCIRVPMFAAREVSKVLKLGTIVLVYDKVSFVSALDWIKNPRLKEAALANVAADDDYGSDASRTKTKLLTIKKSRPRMIRA
jgi:peptidoglycan hydrolase-like protein with peptidoglycan-binding domain